MSSVLKRKRTLSDMEFWKNGVMIRAEVLIISENPFLYPDNRLGYRMSEGLVNAAEKMVEYIRKANSIYITCDAEFNLRIKWQNESISFCEVLLDKLQEIYLFCELHIETNDKDLNNKKKKLSKRIQGISEKVIYEEELLRGWKRKTKKQYAEFKEKQKQNNKLKDASSPT